MKFDYILEKIKKTQFENKPFRHLYITEKVCEDNNSIIMFAPSNDTLHSVRLDYNHLPLQRTQIYGNLMFAHERAYRVVSHKTLSDV